ncbi:DNZ54_00345 family protein [Pantoea sp. Cy-640]|uniref:DNZ54_00345 family protein n=1 Tax=Pantoea sp. Cy-640 TaxID=2608353 RepID=UPI00141A3579|nr:DNZ54_00345 family protein [Pantoea sp. Cy-640]NIG15852.1 peptidase [Pantoea sp. Cy-640]
MSKHNQGLVVWGVLLTLVMMSLMSQNGAAMHIVVALVWLINIFTGSLAGCAVGVLFSEGATRQRLKAALQKVLAGSGAQAAPKYAGWLLKLLIVMSLAFSGWVITLVCYLLAVVIYNLLRSQLAEPAAV